MKCGFLTVSYSGQFYDGPALPVFEQIRKARALGFEGIAIETKRPVASPLDLSAGDRQAIGRSAAEGVRSARSRACRISPARSWRNARTTSR